jgi:4-amino-4-deoxy-L-arabinose transferase-like glycosyltransferase
MMPRIRPVWILAAIVIASSGLTMAAMRRTSTTFDEIVMIAAGARGYETARWQIALEHPPFTQYMYGLLPYLAGAKYPSETGVPEQTQRQIGYRYLYAQTFFWNMGNHPEKLAFLGRLPAVLCAVLLMLTVFAFTRRHYGAAAGVVAAGIVAFTPDVLAHGGVAYNDIPIAFAFFLATWLLDTAIRTPTVSHAVFAGAATGLALGIKNSAVGLALLAVVLLAIEAATRPRDAKWWQQVGMAAAVTVFVMYLTLVVIYRGDFALTEYRYALDFVFMQIAATAAPSYLLGEISREGFWYYFPVVFFLKTSAAFHVLIALAVIYYAARVRSLRTLLTTPLRAPLFGALVFAVMLARSQLHIGFRYALPILPMIAVLIAPAVVHIWSTNWHRLRPVVAVALVWLVVHPLTYYPNFLAYVSEYGPGRDRNYEALADSSLDWGQGLLQLRDYMREHRIDRVYLSYFGSAAPAGYGIDYEPLISFFPLPAPPKPGPQPRYVAISATNLTGAYFGDRDPFRQFREQEPEAVIAHTIYLYRIQ